MGRSKRRARKTSLPYRIGEEKRDYPFHGYASNEKNYTLLFERLCKKQKGMEFTVGAVLVLLTLVLAGAANGLLG